jgi:multidrug ABC transporter, permease protein
MSFATFGTGITSLILLPVLSIVFDVLLGSDLSSPDLVRIGYAAALVSLAATAANGIVNAVAADRNLGIFQEVFTRRRFDPAYWVSVAIVPGIFSLITGAVTLTMVFLFSPDHNIQLLTRVLVLAFFSLICGLLLGVAAAGIGVNLPDPYLGGTILTSTLPILAGVIVPVSDYPTWLAALGWVTPLSGVTASLTDPDFILVAKDFALAIIWCTIGVISTRHAMKRLRSGIRRDVL